MDNITIPIDDIVKNGLSINEYLLLYNTANGSKISGLIDVSLSSLVSLESKGFIKISDDQIFLREKASIFFTQEDSLFLKWLETYPTMVKTGYGRKRALSPASIDTILGKRLERKWNIIFKNNVEEQQRAIKVLELQIKDMGKTSEMEYFVEAARWLNEGYHEKYSYLLDSDVAEELYSNEDYM